MLGKRAPWIRLNILLLILILFQFGASEKGLFGALDLALGPRPTRPCQKLNQTFIQTSKYKKFHAYNFSNFLLKLQLIITDYDL